ncbi:MAG: hypothetical protein ACRCYQ_11470 [Nocardioides sp.]
MKRWMIVTVVAVAATVLGMAPAHARIASFDDPVGDGQGTGRAAGMDITSVEVDYFKEGVEVYINFVDLKRGAYDDIIWVFGDAKKRPVQFAVLNRDGTVFSESVDGGGEDCAGVQAEVSARGDYAYLSLPADCLGGVDPIRVQVGAEARGGGDLDWTGWSGKVRQG